MFLIDTTLPPALPFLVLLFSVLSLLYVALLAWLYAHWRKIPQFNPSASEPSVLPSLSVVIPVRNEAANIEHLLRDLSQQITQKGQPFSFEVIVVDDDSDDDTVQRVTSFPHQRLISLRLETLRLPDNFVGSHKKMALRQAIEQAAGDVIVTTDGDCRVHPHWLHTIRCYFAHYQPVLLSGPVTFVQERNLFEALQTVEFASLIGTGAACLHAGYPNMANGANLAFTRRAFYAVDGYAGTLHVPSGDDEFLLHKMARHYPGRLAFVRHSAAVVHTTPPPTLRAFDQQRKRWAGKWKLHRDYRVAILALFIFSYHLCWMVTFAAVCLGFYPWMVWVAQVLPKSILEYLLLRSVLTALQKPLPPVLFALWQLIYAPYAVFFGMRANFGRYTWKNRTYQ